jgi:hypothetical protein
MMEKGLNENCYSGCRVWFHFDLEVNLTLTCVWPKPLNVCDLDLVCRHGPVTGDGRRARGDAPCGHEVWRPAAGPGHLHWLRHSCMSGGPELSDSSTHLTCLFCLVVHPCMLIYKSQALATKTAFPLDPVSRSNLHANIQVTGTRHKQLSLSTLYLSVTV